MSFCPWSSSGSSKSTLSLLESLSCILICLASCVHICLASCVIFPREHGTITTVVLVSLGSGDGISVRFVVSLHVKVHGIKYARDHSCTCARTHTHTPTRTSGCGTGSLSTMVDGSVGDVMETLSWSSAGPLPSGKIGQSADSISLGYF